MLPAMHRSRPLPHGLAAVTLGLAVLACSGGAPSLEPVATAPPTPTPAPSVDIGAVYARAVVAAFASDPLVVRVVQTAKLTVTDGKNAVKETVSMTLDLSDRDLRAELTTKTGKRTSIQSGW